MSYATLKQWIYKGTLRTVQTAGGHHRVSEAELDRFLAPKGRRGSLKRPRSSRPPTVLAALSGRNQLRGVVEEVRTDGLMAQIRLRIGDQSLTAIITRDAVDALRLRRGDEALAVIKSTEVMVAKEAMVRSKGVGVQSPESEVRSRESGVGSPKSGSGLPAVFVVAAAKVADEGGQHGTQFFIDALHPNLALPRRYIPCRTPLLRCPSVSSQEPRAMPR